jgi:hypothetical protein
VRSLSFPALLAALTVAAAVACGGSSPPPETPPVASTAPTATEPPAPTPPPGAADAGATAEATPGAQKPEVPTTEAPKFDSLPKDKKAEVMMTKVVPNVGAVFKEYNAKRYEKFGCATCHGPTKKEDPHKVLPKLTLSKGGFEKLAKAKPDVVKFMSEKVEPAMAAALGEKPYDQTTHKGFGCAGCHTVN